MCFSNKQIKIFLYFFIFIFLFYIVNIYIFHKDSDKLRVNFFDVGQGDSIFIQTPNNKDILIDGGPDRSVLEHLGRTMLFYDKFIDIIIITHAHADHISGVIEVLKRYSVGEIYYNGIFYNSDVYTELIKQASKYGVKLNVVDSMKKIDIGENLSLEFLFPVEDMRGKDLLNTNNSSLVTRIDYIDDSFLFVGDAEHEEESVLLKNRQKLDSDVLKVGHQGAGDSSSVEFLEVVMPRIAVISVGADNKFGHPSNRVIRRIKRINADIYRTDIDGTIKIISDGSGVFNVKTEKR